MSCCRERLKSVWSNPPFVTFIATLLLLGIILLTYGFYIGKSTHDPNIQDWNGFLSHFDDVSLCYDQNINQSLATIDPESLIGLKSGEKLEHVSTQVNVQFKFSKNFTLLLSNVNWLTFMLKGKDFGRQGDLASANVIGIVNLVHTWPICPSNNTYCTEGALVGACMDLFSTQDILPNGHKPTECSGNSSWLLTESPSSSNGIREALRVVKNAKQCGGRLESSTNKSIVSNNEWMLVKLPHKFDLKLTAISMLSLEDRSLINLHMLHTSFFVFVMAGMLLVFSLANRRTAAAAQAATLTNIGIGNRKRGGFVTLVNE